MKHLSFAFAPALFALVACSSSSSPSNPAAPNDAGADASPSGPLDLPTQADIDDVVKPLMDGAYTHAMVIGYVDATGSVVYGYGKGVADAVPDGDTIFEIGSVTKTFTSLWLASQVGNGVTLDDPVANYLPSGTVVPTRSGKAITLGNLSTHTSGLPRLPTNISPADPNNPYADYTVSDLYAFLGSYALLVDPGTSYTYSNVGAGLLGHALTLHAGAGSYETNIANVIGAPLGLVDTAETLTAAQKARLASGHDGDLGDAEAWTATNAIEGAGQLHSTAHDLLKLVSAEIGLTTTTLAPAMALTQTKVTVDDVKRATGLGLTLESYGAMWNDGETGGYTSFIGFDPVKRCGIVVVADTANDYTGVLGLTLIQRLQGRSAPPLTLPASIALTDDQLNAFVGTYAFKTNNPPLVITLKDHVLQSTGVLGTSVNLYPSTPTDFALRRVTGSVLFSGQTATLSIEGQASDVATKM